MDPEPRAVSGELLLDVEGAAGPRHARLGGALRSAIVEGRLPTGTVLPPSRVLAAELGWSRWVVTEAYGQLVDEGYLVAHRGSATRVGALPGVTGDPVAAVPAAGPPVRFDLRPGVPDLGAFPRARWTEAYRTAARVLPTAALMGSEPYAPWAEAVTGYLRRVRSARVTPHQLEPTAGSTAAARTVADALLRAGHDRVAVEDPSWSGLRDAMARVGLRVVPIEVDADGIVVDRLAGTGARAVITTPAHQFPTGAVLSAERREALLRWAVTQDAVIVEDDYDAEFRHDRQPVAALQGMAPDRVILMGSVSKTLAPGLRLGWLIRPARWRTSAGTPPGVLDQAALAELLVRGRYDRQLRDLRRQYGARRRALIAALARHLPHAEVLGARAGMHLLLRLPDGTSAADLADRAGRAGIRLATLAQYALKSVPATAGTVVVGFGNLRPGQEDDVARLLGELVQELRTGGDAGPRSR